MAEFPANLLFQHPATAVGFVIGAIVLFAATRRLLVDLIEGPEADRQAQQIAEQQKHLLQAQDIQRVEKINRRVVQELEVLTGIARQQILGEPPAESVVEVDQCFARIHYIAERHHDASLRSWVRSTSDAYHFEVRRLMKKCEAESADPAVQLEVLEEIHQKYTHRLRIFTDRNGSPKFFITQNSDGTPFDLEAAEREFIRHPARHGMTSDGVSR